MAEPWDLTPAQREQLREAQAKRKATRARLLAEKPWETPAVGDHVQTADGRQYRQIVRFETTLGPTAG